MGIARRRRKFFGNLSSKSMQKHCFLKVFKCIFSKIFRLRRILKIDFTTFKKFPPLFQIVQKQGGKFLKGCKISKIFASGGLPKHWFLMVFGIFRGFKTPKIFACGDPTPSHGLSVVLQCLNLKKPCLWRAFGAWFLCETVFKNIFTSVGRCSYYS